MESNETMFTNTQITDNDGKADRKELWLLVRPFRKLLKNTNQLSLLGHWITGCR